MLLILLIIYEIVKKILTDAKKKEQNFKLYLGEIYKYNIHIQY